LKLAWSSANVGTSYYIVIDVNHDGKYKVGTNDPDLTSAVFTVGKATTTVNAPTFTGSTGTVGVAKLITATVSGSGVAPTGTVQFQVKIGAAGFVNTGSPVDLASGSASLSYTPQTAAVYEFKAVYSGDGNYVSGTTSVASSDLTVGKGTTALDVTCSPVEVDKTGSQITTISGFLKSSGEGVNSVDIVLSYSLNSIDYTPFHTTQTKLHLTDQDGYYSYDWDVPFGIPNGMYIIQAEFTTNDNYIGSMARTGASPNGDNLNVLPEYVLGGLAALGACFIGFAVFKKRSNLPQLFHR
jgi:hypothetical protein